MPRARILAVVILLLSYGAVGARQPAVRSAAPLPAPAATIAQSFGLSSADRSRILLDIIRVMFGPADAQQSRTRDLEAARRSLTGSATPGETVPLPLDPSIWRDTLLKRDIPDAQLVSAILSSRNTALFYYGLAALDDETLAWLGPDRDLLADLLRYAGTFAAFGRSLRVKAGRVAVPGGPDAEPIWEAVIGASPARPDAFARRLFSRREGRLAFFYDTIAHLREPAQRFALASSLPSGRLDRVRALAQVFDQTTEDFRPDERPFSRQMFDPALTLSALKLDDEGRFVGPSERWFWEAVFRHEADAEPRFEPLASSEVLRGSEAAPVDAAWIVSRIHRSGYGSGRRRLETVLFAQRNFRQRAIDPAQEVTALRGMSAFPALMLTLERSGITAAPVLAASAARAEALSRISDDAVRRAATLQFQGALAIVGMAMRSFGLSQEQGAVLIASLLAIESGQAGYEGRLAKWIQADLLPCLGPPGQDDARPAERKLLAAIAGVREADNGSGTVEWEGQLYHVDPARAELLRLTRARARQGGRSLDEVLTAALLPRGNAEKASELAIAEILASIVYAANLGDPEGSALAAGNVAIRHDLSGPGHRPQLYAAWKLPQEEPGAPGGWRLTGSLLGSEVPLAKLALRWLDTGSMPPAPRVTSTERQIAALTVRLMSPFVVSDEGRDEIRSAIGRGRARVAALTADREQIERIARDGGLSEWRREALAWTITNEPGRVSLQFSLLELLWLGAPRDTAAVGLDAWGAATLPQSGCLCLEMPRPGAEDHLSGRPVSGVLTARGAEVGLRIAEALSELKLPAALAPGVLAFAMQDVLDSARLAYYDDWTEFSRAASALDDVQIADYVSALAAGGPFIPADRSDRRP